MKRSSLTPPTDRAARTLAVDFANTVACPGCRGGDPLDSTRETGRWIRSKIPGDAPRVRSKDLPALRAFRNELRRLLGAAADHARPASTAMEAINGTSARSYAYPQLRWVRGTWVSEERQDERSASQRLTVLAARSAVDLLGRSHPTAVRRCLGPGCIHFLVARRSQQRWCSPTGCGNRARVQRHYRKLRSKLHRAQGRESLSYRLEPKRAGRSTSPSRAHQRSRDAPVGPPLGTAHKA